MKSTTQKPPSHYETTSRANQPFLQLGLLYQIRTLCNDFYWFTLLLIFLSLVFLLGTPLREFDAIFKTKTLKTLIVFFEWFAGD